MRIWLVVPPRERGQVLNLLPPYHLGYLAQACRRRGHDPRIVDCALEGMDIAALAREVDIGIPDVVGFTMFSSDFPAVADACRVLKRLAMPPVLMVGGIHPSSYGEQTLLAVPEIDYLFCGEAEDSLPALLDLVSREKTPVVTDLAEIPGLGWRAQEQPRINPSANPHELDALGMPAWDLLDPRQYQHYPPTLFVRQRPFAPIITTRGCPYLCTYCAGHNVSGHRIRNRSLGLVFEELELLRNRFGIREIHIEDDNFTWQRERVMAFCEGLLQRNWKLTWTMPNGVRLDTLDLELLKLMKQAGCYLLILGVESGSDRILQHMQKKITVAQVEEKVRLVRQAGILPHAFFMLGYPEETPEDIQATLRLALRLPLIGAHFSSYRPLPGTLSAAELIARGEISDFDFSPGKSTFASVVYAPKGQTIEQIKDFQKHMLLHFYLRPGILWLYLRELLRHPGMLLNLARKAWRYLKP